MFTKPIVEQIPTRLLSIYTNEELDNEKNTQIEDITEENSPFNDLNTGIIYPQVQCNDTIVIPSRNDAKSRVYTKNYIYKNEPEEKCRCGSRSTFLGCSCENLYPKKYWKFQSNTDRLRKNMREAVIVVKSIASGSSLSTTDLNQPTMRGLLPDFNPVRRKRRKVNVNDVLNYLDTLATSPESIDTNASSNVIRNPPKKLKSSRSRRKRRNNANRLRAKTANVNLYPADTIDQNKDVCNESDGDNNHDAIFNHVKSYRVNVDLPAQSLSQLVNDLNPMDTSDPKDFSLESFNVSHDVIRKRPKKFKSSRSRKRRRNNTNRLRAETANVKVKLNSTDTIDHSKDVCDESNRDNNDDVILDTVKLNSVNVDLQAQALCQLVNDLNLMDTSDPKDYSRESFNYNQSNGSGNRNHPLTTEKENEEVTEYSMSTTLIYINQMDAKSANDLPPTTSNTVNVVIPTQSTSQSLTDLTSLDTSDPNVLRDKSANLTVNQSNVTSNTHPPSSTMKANTTNVLQSSPLSPTVSNLRDSSRDVCRESANDKLSGVGSEHDDNSVMVKDDDGHLSLNMTTPYIFQHDSKDVFKDYCSCRNSCRSKRCACVRATKRCNPSCCCKDCDNPLNILKCYDVNIEEVSKDNCLLSALYKIKHLELFMDRTVRIGCCQGEVRLLECIPGIKACPHCDAQIQYSWCAGVVCVESRYPRKHCKVCNKCSIFEKKIYCSCLRKP